MVFLMLLSIRLNNCDLLPEDEIRRNLIVFPRYLQSLRTGKPLIQQNRFCEVCLTDGRFLEETIKWITDNPVIVCILIFPFFKI